MMVSLFLSEQCLPFTASLVVMLILAVLEGVALLCGGGDGFGLMEAADGADTAPDGALDETGAASILLDWFYVGRVPILMLLMLFLFAFGMAGYVIQALSRSASQAFLSAWVAGVGAFCLALPAYRLSGGLLLKIMPRDESQGVWLDSLVGRVGIVVAGKARVGRAGEARVRDEFGRFHYVLVEPDDETRCILARTEVLLVKRLSGSRFQAIENPHAGLIDA